MNPFNDNNRCFVCGPANPAGLGLVFSQNPDSGETETTVTFTDRFQGWEKVAHGGLVAAVLDEVLIQAAAARGLKCVTAEITIAFKSPVPIGAPLRAAGRVTSERGRLVQAESRLHDAGHRLLAQARGKLFKI